MKHFILILTSSLIFFASCKKDKDMVTTHTVKGMVFNNCTDSGLANVTVYLNISDGKNTNETQTISDAQGNFTFDNVQIHSASNYTYAIYIPSKSGINGGGGTEVGFQGANLYFNYDEADAFLKPRVKPSYFSCTIYCIPIPIKTQYDTIIFHAYNYTLHKNRPTDVYYWGGGGIGNDPSSPNHSSYPMGKYNIEMDIWKSGLHTHRKDSIYLGWGANTTYTINW